MGTACCKLRDGSVISEENEPYVTAEVNTSHNGDVELAKKMAATAKEIGCDCVKFQSWSAESLYSKTYYDENPIAKRFVKKFALSQESQKEIAKYCKSIGISFASTPYSREEVDFLISECDVPYIKVASMDVNNYPFLKYIAQTQMPIILATGMADFSEVKKAVETIEHEGNQNICLLHCISIYPVDASFVQLKNIVGLKEEFPNYPVGFSDHSIGTELAAAAIALGASAIEKHLTLDKSKIGMDNNMATEPEEFKQLVTQCKNVYHALGTEQKKISTEEILQREKMRRSIVLTRDMKKGETLRLSDMDVKRPGTGLPPEEMEDLVGMRLENDVEANILLSMDNLES